VPSSFSRDGEPAVTKTNPHLIYSHSYERRINKQQEKEAFNVMSGGIKFCKEKERRSKGRE
jgi:hypothetical protein